MTSQFDRYKATLPYDRQVELEQLRGVCMRETPIPKIKRVTRSFLSPKETNADSPGETAVPN